MMWRPASFACRSSIPAMTRRHSAQPWRSPLASLAKARMTASWRAERPCCSIIRAAV